MRELVYPSIMPRVIRDTVSLIHDPQEAVSCAALAVFVFFCLLWRGQPVRGQLRSLRFLILVD